MPHSGQGQGSQASLPGGLPLVLLFCQPDGSEALIGATGSGSKVRDRSARLGACAAATPPIQRVWHEDRPLARLRSSRAKAPKGGPTSTGDAMHPHPPPALAGLDLEGRSFGGLTPAAEDLPHQRGGAAAHGDGSLQLGLPRSLGRRISTGPQAE
jgi:hypothetical protein